MVSRPGRHAGGRSRLLRILLVTGAVLAAVLLSQQGRKTSTPHDRAPEVASPDGPAPGASNEPGVKRYGEPAAPSIEAHRGAEAVADAFRARRSNVWVEAAGVVARTLPDDRSGLPHQRFVVRLEDGQTVLVSHNLDLAPRVPIAVGDPVAFRGEYEWNDLGGVIHWTHHDPAGRMPGGWIRVGGRTYR
jgi:hypothetical protein